MLQQRLLTITRLGVIAVSGLAGTAHAQYLYQYSGAGFPIVDAQDHFTSIVVTDTFRIASVRVTYLGMTHGRAGDLHGILSHTDSINASAYCDMFSRPGAITGNDVGAVSSVSGNYTFADTGTTTFWEAAVAAGSGVVPNAAYHPSQSWNAGVPLSYMSVFNGDTAAGTWTLDMSDSDPGFEGSVSGWLLELEAVPACYANCDGSTAPPLLNANDFQCFLNTFAAGDPYANCDGSTAIPVLNVNDFQCFLNTFAAGCS